MLKLLSKVLNLLLQDAEDCDPSISREETSGTHSEADPSGKSTVDLKSILLCKHTRNIFFIRR